MKLIHLLTCFLLAASNLVFAGSADAIIKGRTESGRTEIEVRVGDLEGLVSFVKVTIDGESYTFHQDDIGATVIRDTKNGIYVIALNAKGKQFRLWMIPKTENVLQSGNGVYRSRFAAVLEATDPRKAKAGNLTERITIGCTLNYSI